MTAERQNYEDLALGCLQRSLGDSEKRLVQRLIMEDALFLAVLKEEIELKRKFAALKTPLPPAVKTRIGRNIVEAQNERVYTEILKPVLEATMPAVLSPFLQLLQRSVLVHE
ncbi:MAG TPA: hypothetical protein GX528_05870 [Firmicutes bacterium]|nr:hypothetical protein [Bacillota bacterium]